MAMEQGIGLVVLVVKNATMDTYRDVEVKLSMPAGVSPFLDPDEVKPENGWAKPPKPWGSSLAIGLPQSAIPLVPPQSVLIGTNRISGTSRTGRETSLSRCPAE